VAYEIGQRLRDAGQQVGLLVLFDTNAPGYPVYLPTITSFRRKLHHFRFRVELHWGNIRVATPALRWEYIRAKSGRFVRQYKAKSKRKFRDISKRMRHLLLPRPIRNVQKGGVQANRSYEPMPYTGKLTLFRAVEQPYDITPDRSNGWERLAVGGLEIFDIPGHHGAIMREPRVRVLVDTLMACLRNARGDGNGHMQTITKEEHRGE
jgi:thioesterase domain-containing protein